MAEQKSCSKKNATPVSTSSRLQINPNGIKELSERLVDLVSGNEINRELIQLVHYLKSKSLRHERNAHAFRISGGLAALMRLLPLCTKHAKNLTLLLGTLGNLCALEQETRSMDSGVVNTASRVLGNLAVDQSSLLQIRSTWEGMTRDLTSLLSTVQASSCKQSILRALRVLCTDHISRAELRSQEQLVVLADCLRATDKDLVAAALRTTDALTQSPDPDAIHTLCTSGMIPVVMDHLTGGSSRALTHCCINILLSCAQCSEGRTFLGSAGGVEALYRYTQTCKVGDRRGAMFSRAVRGVCWCCKDVVSRQRVRDCGALGEMVRMLSEAESAPLHPDILSALICFYFDENTLKFMVRMLGLLKALTYHLRKAMEGTADKGRTEGGVSASSVPSSCKDSSSESEEISMAWEHEGYEVPSDGSSTSSIPPTLPRTSTCPMVTTSSPSTPSLLLHPSSFSHTPSSHTSSSQTPSSHTSSSHTPSSHTSSSPNDQSEDIWSIAMECSPLHPSLPETEAPPSKRPRLSLDPEHHKPVPANFIDSLLSPHPGSLLQATRGGEAPVCIEPITTSTEGQVVLLLSRVSHLRDCLGCLATPEVLVTVLDYFFSTSVLHPNTHCFKVLVRIFMNPHCLRDCVVSLVPSLIYQRLRFLPSHNTGPSLPPDVMQETPTSSMTSSLSFAQPPRQESSVSQFHTSPVGASGRLSTAAVSDPIVSDSPSTAAAGSLEAQQQHHSFYALGQELLEKLSKVAESPYGQGVLAHTLLRGGTQEQEASVLALPLLSRSSRFRQKMMVEYRGLEVLIRLVKTRGSSSTHSMAIDSLLLLACRCLGLDSVPLHDQQHPVSCCLTAEHPTHPSSQDMTQRDLIIPPYQHHCRYMDTDHDPFDTRVIVQSNGTSGTFLVHRSALQEMSEMFAAMLSGRYQESSCGVITIKGIRPSVLSSVLHFMYGCHWSCPEVMATVLDEETAAVTQSTDSVADLEQFSLVVNERCIDAITSQLSEREDGIMTGHCLRVLACAGRFLIPDLIAACEGYLDAVLCPGMVVPLFQFSELHSSGYLRARCIHCLLRVPHTDLRRAVFRELLDSSDGEEAITLIQRLIISPH